MIMPSRLLPWLLLFMLGCNTVGSVSAVKSSGSSSPVVLVYMGGFNSCNNGPRGLNGYEQFVSLMQGITGREVRYVLSCFDGMASTTIQWISSAEPDTTYGVPWDQPDQPGQLFDEVQALSDDFADPIYIIGHSYGGWLASDLTAHLGIAAAAQGVPSDFVYVVHDLFTIDPISPYHCNQGKYAATVAKWSLSPVVSLIAAFLPPDGCEHSPPQYTTRDDQTYPGQVVNDGDGKIRGLITASTRDWHNFYQTRDYLHSSDVAQDQGQPSNQLINYGVFLVGTSTAPHQRIHVEPAVWNEIKAVVLADANGGEAGDGGGGDFGLVDSGPSDAIVAQPPAGAVAPLDVSMTPDTANAVINFVASMPGGEGYGPLSQAATSQWLGIVGGNGPEPPAKH